MSRFDSYNSFLRRRYKLIILAWIIALFASLVFIPGFFSSVSYNIGGSNFGGTSNAESQVAQNIINAQFPSSAGNGNNSILLVIQSPQVYSTGIRNAILSLNDALSSDPNVANYSGITSVYSTEYDLLNSTVPTFIPAVASLAKNISSINVAEYSLQSNLSALHSQIFELQSGINETAQLVYGTPSLFVTIWENAVSNGASDPYRANQIANATIENETKGFGGNAQSIGYYSVFYRSWNASFSILPNSTSVLTREQASINQSVSATLNDPSLSQQTKGVFSSVGKGLNVTTWNKASSVSNLTISSIASSLPINFSALLGISSNMLVTRLYDLGPSTSNSTLAGLVIELITSAYEGASTQSSGFSIGNLVNDSYAQGRAPVSGQIWELASGFFSNATADSFAKSPVFAINASAMTQFIGGLGENSTRGQISSAANEYVSSKGFNDYPYVLSSSLTKNFVSPSNNTMMVILNFDSNPNTSAIDSVKSHVQNSNLSRLSTVYVTGSPVISEDVSNAFTPALKVTVPTGVAVSILIVGLLFLAPLAALIPLLIGGFSVVIAYAAIYIGIVEIGKGTPSFLTPTLTTLLMLGLAVDYSVLQLRRTREERLNGNSKEESIAISVKWAGQAVLTAGLTVIVAYIVMAVANVPLFSDVGTAIALGVSILLAASLTLLPALELAIGDKMFWPRGLRSRKRSTGKSTLLERITSRTIRRKVLVVGVISALALGAFAVGFGTPTGVDFLKLLPNFPSNQGLTVLTNSLGSGTIAPSEIVITTPTPIVYGHNQFNLTLLDEIEKISQSASNSQGVVSVTGPTRPFSSPFNYSQLTNMPEPVYSQYLNGVMSQIGENNKTALILVGLSNQSQTAQAVSSLRNVESSISRLALTNGVAVLYGGETQGTYDSETFINGIIPQVVLILAIAVYIILFAQLRSAFTPLRLVFTILCSVAFALALLSVVFYYALALPILDLAPLFVVVTMLGVGIDYDIFFVTRIREEVLKGKTDNEAIRTAVSKVWVTIFGLGLVLATVFGSLLVTGIPILQEMSLAVSSAVMIDVGVVILFFVPALMAVAQRFNWWPSRRTRNPPVE
ncbi:MAG: MMPL family transporter [Nitrososphaerales archaeon]